MKHFIRFWYPPIIWGLIIFTFSAQTTPSTSSVQWQDFSVKKFAHVVEYSIFAMLIFRGLYNSGIKLKKALLISFLFPVLYAVTDEFHQSFTPGREPHIRDVIFDTIGAGISILTIWKYLPTAPKPLKRLASDLQILLKEGK